MNQLRLFIACKLNKEILAKSIDVQKRLKDLNLDVKWVEEGNIHITLKFLGILNPDLLGGLTGKLETIARNHTVFDLCVETLGVFPRLSGPKVIWIGSSSGIDKLKLLAGDIEEAVKEFNVLKEEKEFNAHITLGRVRSPKNREKLVEFIEKNKEISLGKTEIRYFTLFQSQLSKAGAVYSDLKTFMLKPK